MRTRMRSSWAAFGLALITLAALTGCGSDSLSSPSDSGGVTLRGTVVGIPVAGSGLTAMSGPAAAETVTVTVLEEPTITTTVGPDGTFTLRGLPAGTFTLVFSMGGVEIGTAVFDAVAPNQEITVTVSVAGGAVTIVEQRRNGIGHGDIEIEGRVEQVMALVPGGESRFLIDGHTVVARPGETAIRQGNRSRGVEDVTEGRRVHVKGVWMTPSGSTQEVLAHEIKLQGNSDGDGGDDGDGGGGQPACAAGTRAQIEGRIASKGSSTITIQQHGRDNECEVDGGTRIRKGNTTFTFDQLQPGWRVHVSGRFLGLSGSTCRVDADEIKVQQQ